MEEQNRQMPPTVYPENSGKYFWRVASPLVVQMTVTFLVSAIVSVVFGAAYIMKHYGITADVMNDTAQMELITQKFMQDYAGIAQEMSAEMYQYGALIQGVNALAVIPFLAVMFHRDRVKEKLNGFVPNKKAALWKYTAVILLGAALCTGVNNLMILGNISTVGDEYVTMMEALYAAPIEIQLIALVVLVPISEELVYRGLIFQRIRERSSFAKSAFHSALIFGLMHMNLVQMLYGFLLGLVFAYLYEKYGSVKAPVLAHMTANFVSVVGMHLNWFDWMAEEPMRIGVITVACAALASTMYVLVRRMEEKAEAVQ